CSALCQKRPPDTTPVVPAGVAREAGGRPLQRLRPPEPLATPCLRVPPGPCTVSASTSGAPTMPADQQPDPLDRDGFARLLIDRLRQAGETAEIHYEADGFRLHVTGENEHFANLSNLYAEYGNAGEEQRQRLLRNYARS